MFQNVGSSWPASTVVLSFAPCFLLWGYGSPSNFRWFRIALSIAPVRRQLSSVFRPQVAFLKISHVWPFLAEMPWGQVASSDEIFGRLNKTARGKKNHEFHLLKPTVCEVVMFKWCSCTQLLSELGSCFHEYFFHGLVSQCLVRIQGRRRRKWVLFECSLAVRQHLNNQKN